MSLLVNLAFLPERPTGWATYSLNLLKALPLPDIKAVSPTPLTENIKTYPAPIGLTTEFGAKGHLKRLLWTQFYLPKIYQNLGSKLLFSPVPESPISKSCRAIVTIHDLIPLHFPQWFSSAQKLYCRYYIPAVLRQVEQIICNSQATAQDVVDFFGISAKKVIAIPLAYDASNFHDLHLPGKNYFLYLGRHNPHKNPQRLIAAFAALPNCSDYELWLAGPTDPRYTPALQTQIAELNLQQQVKFLDYVPYAELPRLLNQAIALVFPSLWEGFGLPVLEAMACGTPVITSDLASLPEVAGDAAVLVNPYRVAELTQAMQAIATDTSLRSQLRERGLARATQFSWAKTGQATAEILQPYL
ncbi:MULTISPECIES: glycosyltransferase family 1 protein [Trichocoleus]|uniref:Glycosyltransferase family 4 protein n=1 Tax=Trichocoleus desertorum GB2-A4 TaxID=2933944 RepID=A0ABV0JA87_9CYAN|nr:glycosyltransferase family 1 protein [Trichocoleus sp. FACHB-46]MBD1861398.1 glycosyltransferase family 4 protein [Trichocoleus sp. FACHB-46]